MTACERETIINYNDGEKTARIYTASPSVMRKLDKLCAELPDTYREVDIHTVQGEVVAKDYVCSDKKLVRLAKPRVLTEEQHTALVERGKRNARHLPHRIKSDVG